MEEFLDFLPVAHEQGCLIEIIHSEIEESRVARSILPPQLPLQVSTWFQEADIR